MPFRVMSALSTYYISPSSSLLGISLMNYFFWLYPAHFCQIPTLVSKGLTQRYVECLCQWRADDLLAEHACTDQSCIRVLRAYFVVQKGVDWRCMSLKVGDGRRVWFDLRSPKRNSLCGVWSEQFEYLQIYHFSSIQWKLCAQIRFSSSRTHFYVLRKQALCSKRGDLETHRLRVSLNILTSPH